jgi:F420-dependent oxidoreductase-like protein
MTGFRVFVEAQRGYRYGQILRLATAVSHAGLDGLFSSDHFQATHPGTGSPGPLDVWVTLAGLARETERITIGALMCSATFRSPAQLAVSVAQVDEMSGGRLMLGMGAGWFEPEHRSLGLPFPPRAERFSRLTEQLEILQGLWSASESFTYQGQYYQVTNNPALPRHSGVPIIIGGTGPVRTPLLAARFASEYNVPHRTLPQAVELFRALDKACALAGRDRSTIKTSVVLKLCIGRTSSEVRTRAERIGPSAITGVITGTPAQAAATIRQWQSEAAPDHIYLHLIDIDDLDHLDLFATEVLPSLDQ